MRVVVATHNSGKLAEFRALLPQGSGWEFVPLNEFTDAAAAEDACTFIENALGKARYASAQSGLAALADDSGLEVDALDGAPGVHSARYAGADASSQDNIAKLLDALRGHSGAERTARFRCALVFMRHPSDPCPLLQIGTWDGRIADTPSGENGFGYDPIFIPDGYQQTAAQLEPKLKNRISHRAQALRQLARQLF